MKPRPYPADRSVATDLVRPVCPQISAERASILSQCDEQINIHGRGILEAAETKY